jgi:D-aminopeptidase
MKVHVSVDIEGVVGITDCDEPKKIHDDDRGTDIWGTASSAIRRRIVLAFCGC